MAPAAPTRSSRPSPAADLPTPSGSLSLRTPLTLLKHIPEDVCTPALGAHDEIRDGAWVAELTGLMDLSSWPAGMRVIVRKK